MKPVPTFYPTEEEFSDFYAYMTSIESQVQPFGLCKIVPPASWNPRVSGYDNIDIEIPSPIRQYVQGSQGVYQILNVMEKKMTFQEFKKEAELQEERGLKAAQRRKKPEDKDEFDELEELERMYWKNLTFHAPLYGADMLGTLFEEPEGKPPSSWNLNNLDSLLNRKLPFDIPGVTQPYLYFGMWKAMFGCHTEDMELFSINYLHFGKPKMWYCAPPSQKEKFDRLAQVHYPHHFKDCSEFLRHKSSMLSPSVLRASNITLTKAVQRAGEFMITFPGAYHFGFNIGLNCAESVNFALESWVKHGAKARSCQCITDSVTIDMTCFDPTWKPPPASRSRKAKDSAPAGSKAKSKETPSRVKQEKPAPLPELAETPQQQPQPSQLQQQQQQETETKSATRRTTRKTAGQGGVVARAEALEASLEAPVPKKPRKRTAKMPKTTSPEKKRKITAKTAFPEVKEEPFLMEPPATPNEVTLPKRVRIIQYKSSPTIPPLSEQPSPNTVTYPKTDMRHQTPMSRSNNTAWSFSCMCGEKVSQGDPAHLHPKGLVFECSQCQTWGHVNCYANFVNIPIEELPKTMLCYLCRVRQHIQSTKNGAQSAEGNGRGTIPARIATKLGATIELLKPGDTPIISNVQPSPQLYSSFQIQPSRVVHTPSPPRPTLPTLNDRGQMTKYMPPIQSVTNKRKSFADDAPVAFPSNSSPSPSPSPSLSRAPSSSYHQPQSQPSLPRVQHHLPPLRQSRPSVNDGRPMGLPPPSSLLSSTTCAPSPTALASNLANGQKQKANAARGRYMCGRCGMPKKGHVCPYAENEQEKQAEISQGMISKDMQERLPSPMIQKEQPSVTYPPSTHNSLLHQQQSQIDAIKQRLQHLQQLQGHMQLQPPAARPSFGQGASPAHNSSFTNMQPAVTLPPPSTHSFPPLFSTAAPPMPTHHYTPLPNYV